MIAQPVSRIRHLVLVVLAASGLAACAGSAEKGRSSATRTSASVADRAVAVALDQVGVPYRYGGSNPSGFDCSGLVHFSYATAGKRIPRTTSGQWAQLAPVSNANIRSGDLLFFEISGKMSHVGLYIGDGRFVHAPSSGKTVTIEHLGSDYYRKAFIRAGRPY